MIISGGQNGADISGLTAAKVHHIPTGGSIPFGFKTLDGPKPEYAELYNLIETKSDKYPPRTYENAKNSDATIRFARDFSTAGEKCTQKAIDQYKKLQFDVLIKDVNKFTVERGSAPKDVSLWLNKNNIKILNVAGNSEKTCPGIEVWVMRYLLKVIELLNARD